MESNQTQFIHEIAAQFEQGEGFTADTRYREQGEWSSLLALSVIAVIYKKYRVRLKGDEIRATHTLGELYDLVASKQ